MNLTKCSECGFYYADECINCKTEDMGIAGMDYVVIRLNEILKERSINENWAEVNNLLFGAASKLIFDINESEEE